MVIPRLTAAVIPAGRDFPVVIISDAASHFPVMMFSDAAALSGCFSVKRELPSEYNGKGALTVHLY